MDYNSDMKPCILFLTCANTKEANLVSETLLKKHLIVCVKKSAVSSSFLWEGKIDSASEILLIMDSVEENFERIEKELKKIHSYKSFVLVLLPIIKTTKGVKKWIEKEIKHG